MKPYENSKIDEKQTEENQRIVENLKTPDEAKAKSASEQPVPVHKSKIRRVVNEKQEIPPYVKKHNTRMVQERVADHHSTEYHDKKFAENIINRNEQIRELAKAGDQKFHKNFSEKDNLVHLNQYQLYDLYQNFKNIETYTDLLSKKEHKFLHIISHRVPKKTISYRPGQRQAALDALSGKSKPNSGATEVIGHYYKKFIGSVKDMFRL